MPLDDHDATTDNVIRFGPPPRRPAGAPMALPPDDRTDEAKAAFLDEIQALLESAYYDCERLEPDFIKTRIDGRVIGIHLNGGGRVLSFSSTWDWRDPGRSAAIAAYVNQVNDSLVAIRAVSIGPSVQFQLNQVIEGGVLRHNMVACARLFADLLRTALEADKEDLIR